MSDNPDSRAESSGTISEKWKMARSAIEHENGLVNHRMTWFFQSQAFLFAAFAVIYYQIFDHDDLGHKIVGGLFLLLVCMYACYICLVIQKGIEDAYTALSIITVHYEEEKVATTPSPITNHLHIWTVDKTLIGEYLAQYPHRRLKWNLYKYADQLNIPIATFTLWSALAITIIATTVVYLLQTYSIIIPESHAGLHIGRQLY
jgi:hypothetical protein